MYIQYHLDKMRDRHFYNAVRPRFGDLRTAIKDEGPTEVRAIITELHTLARNDPALATDIHDATDVYTEVIDRYMEDRPHRADEVLGVPTGWRWLDAQTGGWQRGDIITLAARPERAAEQVALRAALLAGALVHDLGLRTPGRRARRRDLAPVATCRWAALAALTGGFGIRSTVQQARDSRAKACSGPEPGG